MRKNSTEFLKECMADAIIELLNEKPLEKISVNEISKRSGVGRATWFRHFSTKTEAITYKLILLWYRYCINHGITEEQRLTVDNALDFFNFSLENKELYNLLYKNGLQTLIYDAFYQVITHQHRATPVEYYKSRFLSYGVYGIVDEWVKRDYAESPEEIASIIHTTVFTEQKTKQQ